ncbi:hypothetical protein G7Y89_g14099 [Cudoniella acicularis]|uniref:Intradiol ring-cleavage dioxygenases domain-containing protein n=1 Tax=Cudoniella acicularis TaxID=354080 RepID=A0A8H4VY15_9HELO|nr:hypothetical protein G7Y89_g14099 [Cudoniella acicularis]
MKFSQAAILLIAAATLTITHPERLTKESAKRELIGRGRDKCAAQIEARKVSMLAKRSASLRKRQIADGKLPKRNNGLSSKRDEHDVREGQSGVDFYLDIGVINVETCKPLPKAYLPIWHCNATGSYSGFIGIDPDTSDLLDGYTKQTDGTTDKQHHAHRPNGMAEFLTTFRGYYVTRSTHIHLTVQTNVTTSISYNSAFVQHVGQLFFNESLLNPIYSLSPYSAHPSTLNRTTNSEDPLYTSANVDGYSSVISISYLGEEIAEGLVRYITVGVNSSAVGVETSGENVNSLGVVPTLSVAESVRAAATVVDVKDRYAK